MAYHYRTYKVVQTNANLCKRPAVTLPSHPRPCRVCGTTFAKPGTLCDDCKQKLADQQALDRLTAEVEWQYKYGTYAAYISAANSLAKLKAQKEPK